MKKYIIGLVLGVAISTAGSVFALGGIGEPTLSPIVKLTPAEQIKLGHTFDQYTGKKLVVEPTPQDYTEQRFQAIEKRLEKLEAKKK